jgi:arabinofuranan 3-O-arabinosyltransferase
MPEPTSAPTGVVQRWGDTSRSVKVGPRSDPVLLTVHENQNPGWAATLDGHALRGVTVDGWQQGYVVPVGGAGHVELSFQPQRWMLVGLLIGGGAALALLPIAVWPRRRPRHCRLGAPVGAARAPWPVLAGIVALAAAGGPVGLLTAVIFLSVRPFLARRTWQGLVPLCGGVAIVAAGVLLARNPALTPGYSADAAPVHVLCLVGLAMVLLTPQALRDHVATPDAQDVSRAVPPTGN